jgi:phosphoribosylanthranilate isomerase
LLAMNKNIQRIKTRVKVCGIKEKEDAFICLDAGVQALGFIFYPKSPRYVLPNQARKIIDSLPCFISRVGVFVDDKQDNIEEIAAYTGIDTVQLHGRESAALCRRLRKRFRVIKSFFPKDEGFVGDYSRYKVDGMLFDIPLSEKQKNPDRVLDSGLINKLTKKIDFLILSGGLSPFNVNKLIREFCPYAVDVARGVERFPGKKDSKLVKEFVKAVETANK